MMKSSYRKFPKTPERATSIYERRKLPPSPGPSIVIYVRGFWRGAIALFIADSATYRRGNFLPIPHGGRRTAHPSVEYPLTGRLGYPTNSGFRVVWAWFLSPVAKPRGVWWRGVVSTLQISEKIGFGTRASSNNISQREIIFCRLYYVRRHYRLRETILTKKSKFV